MSKPKNQTVVRDPNSANAKGKGSKTATPPAATTDGKPEVIELVMRDAVEVLKIVTATAGATIAAVVEDYYTLQAPKRVKTSKKAFIAMCVEAQPMFTALAAALPKRATKPKKNQTAEEAHQAAVKKLAGRFLKANKDTMKEAFVPIAGETKGWIGVALTAGGIESGTAAFVPVVEMAAPFQLGANEAPVNIAILRVQDGGLAGFAITGSTELAEGLALRRKKMLVAGV